MVMMKVNLVLWVLVLFGATSCSGYRILSIFPFKGKSHFSVMEQVSKALAEKGHQVDVVSGFPLKEPFPNYTEIFEVPNPKPHEGADWEEMIDRDEIWRAVHRIEREMCELLGHPVFNRLIKNPPKNPPYDLIIAHIFIGYQCFTAIGHLWNVPVIGVSTTFLYAQQSHYIGAPLNLGIVPKNYRVYKENMTFWDRLYNVVMTNHYIYKFYSEAWKQDEIIRRHLGPNVPSYKELEKSVSMMLANSHHSFHGVEPKVPALVEIGGIHITDDNSTIEPEFRKLMDESPEGFMYFSLGSLVQVESLPKKIVEKLFTTFKNLSPIRIIMKFPNPKDLTVELPENVFTFPWVPQRKILQHPKIRGFITHGGGLGSQETVYYGVPTICIPVFADQFVNCGLAKKKNFGIKFDLYADQEEYNRVFNEVLTNPKYKEAAKEASVLFRDRPMSPKEETVYWVEYVIRHGKNVLRSPAVDMKWWQVELLDVYAFIASFALIALFAIMYVALKLFSLISCSIKFSSKKRIIHNGKKRN